MPAPRMLTHNGITQSTTAWAKAIGLNRTTLERRLNRERLALPEALSRPLNTTQRGTAYGDGCIRPDGYRVISRDGKPVMEHVAIAEKAIGKPLPPRAEVHHVDLDRANNAPTNLVVCPDHAYHALLHIRQAAMDATGDPNQRQCKVCHRYSPTSEMAARGGGARFVHLPCEREIRNRNRAKRKEKVCQVQL